MKASLTTLLAAMVLAGAYVGSYFACVEVRRGRFYRQNVAGTLHEEVRLPRYRCIPDGFAQSFFDPMHQLDARYLRRAKWKL